MLNFNFENDFNLQQQKAIKADVNKHHLILAGAGSGKTKVLIARLTYLLKRGVFGCNDYNILVVTFTRKASDELRERTYNYLGYNPTLLWSGTFHHICLKMLKENLDACHLQKNFQILDTIEQKEYIEKIVYEYLQLNKENYNIEEFYDFIQKQKLYGIRHQRCQKNEENALLIDVYREYDLLCQRENKVDFSELLLRATIMLEKHPKIRAHYQNRFKYILIDEFQDIDDLQYRWLKNLVGENTKIFAVGDDDQSIYSFKGANVKNIIDFKNEFAKENVIYLEQNYRSTNNILNGANILISNNNDRIGKNIWSENGNGEKIHIFKAKTPKSEAKWVVSQINNFIKIQKQTVKTLLKEKEQEFKNLNKVEKENNLTITKCDLKEIKQKLEKNYIKYNDVAILYRNNNYVKNVEYYLLKSNIPYKIFGQNIRFFDREEIKDILAYIKVILNFKDSISLNRIINKPSRAIGLKSLKKLNIEALQYKQSLYEYCNTFLNEKKDSQDKNDIKLTEKLIKFFKLLLKLAKPEIEIKSLVDYYNYILNESGLYQYYLEKDKKNAEKKKKSNHIQNLNIFREILEEYDKNTLPTQFIFNSDLLNTDIKLNENQCKIKNIDEILNNYELIKNNIIDKNSNVISDIMANNNNEIFNAIFYDENNLNNKNNSNDENNLNDENHINKDLLQFNLTHLQDFSVIRSRLNNFLNNCYFNEEQSKNENAIQLLTAHASKGLEFKYVFLIGLEQGVFPNLFFVKKENNKIYYSGNIQEERRLMYVAMTRAKEKLYISYAKQNIIYMEKDAKLNIYGNPINPHRKNVFNTRPSIFLKEIPTELSIIEEET